MQLRASCSRSGQALVSGCWTTYNNTMERNFLQDLPKKTQSSGQEIKISMQLHMFRNIVP